MVSEMCWRSHHNTCGTRGHAQSQTCSGRVAARGQPISADKAGARPSWDGNPQVRVRITRRFLGSGTAQPQGADSTDLDLNRALEPTGEGLGGGGRGVSSGLVPWED